MRVGTFHVAGGFYRMRFHQVILPRLCGVVQEILSSRIWVLCRSRVSFPCLLWNYCFFFFENRLLYRVWTTNFCTYANFVKILSTKRECESQKYLVGIVCSHFYVVSFLLSFYGQNHEFFCFI